MQPFTRLFAAAAAAQFADQVALAALPLAAVLLLGAGPELVGTLIAVQGAAWLLVSLPGGVLTDRVPRSRLIGFSQALAALSLAGALVAALTGWWTPFAVLAFGGASGTVLTALAALALVPTLVPRERLARANARLELARASATLAAPIIVGFWAEHANPAFAFGLAAAAAMVASAMGFAIKAPPAAAPERPPVLVALREGAAFALRQPLLRAIVLCAVFWNVAYFALLSVAVPYALERIGLDPKTLGIVQSGTGFGLLAGAAVAAAALRMFEPRLILVFGPGLSVVAALLFLVSARAGGAPAAFAAFFLLGFGPMLWLVCQTSIRQIVTPAALMGRVASVVQVAIYGARPVGALLGGLVAGRAGMDATLGLVVAGFALSAAVPLASALGRLRAMPEAAA